MNSLKRLDGALQTAFPIIGLAVLLFALSCSRKTDTNHDGYDEVTRRFTSLVSEGRFDQADSLVRAEHAQALLSGDSDRWCAAKVNEAVLNFYLCQPDRMLSACDSATAWLRSHPETPKRLLSLQKVLQAKGTVYSQFTFNPDSAIHYLKQGAEVAERCGNRKEYAIALANLADAYKLDSRLDMAAESYHRAILEADTAGFEPRDYISLYGGLATVYTGLRDFDKSQYWWQKTMALEPLMIPFEKFNNLNNLGTDFYYKKDYVGALQTFRALFRWLADSVPSSEWEQNFVAVNLADCYMRLGKTDSVETLIPAAYTYFTEVQPNPVACSYLHTLMMRRDMLKGNIAAVEQLIARHPFSDTLRPEMQILRLELLSDYYSAAGDPDRAFAYYRSLKTLEDSIRSVAIAQSIAANSMAYERDRDLLELKTSNAEQKARIMQLWNIVAVIFILLSFTVWLILDRRKKGRKREDKMLSKIASLRTEAVRSRITPHFIYNTLNHEINNRRAGHESRLKDIVSLLRHQQFVAADIVTTLARELAFTNSYIAVSSDNYPGRLDYTLDIADGLDPETLRMPSMFIQILVENAFKHSFPAIPANEKCHLKIAVSETDEEEVEVAVFNNTPPGVSPLPKPGTGLRVIMETIKILNDRENLKIKFNYRLTHLEDEETGFLATYGIPLKWMKIGEVSD